MGSTTLRTIAIALSSIAISSTTAASTTPTSTTPASATTAGINTTAYQCGSEYNPQNYSSGTQDDNSDYFYLVPTLFDDAVIDKVRDFADELDGRWFGTGLDIRCIFTDHKTHTTINSFDVDAEINKHFQGGLIMELQQENADQVNLDRIFLSPETESYPTLESLDTDSGMTHNTHGQKTGQRSYQIDFASPGTLVYNEKYRRHRPLPDRTDRRQDPLNPVDPEDLEGRPPAPFSSRLVHEIRTVSVNQTDLTVYRDIYVNGKFVSQQQWQLKRW